MKKTVFYSWQSDLPNTSNRGFIEKVLNKAVKEIASDESIGIEPVIDRDTAGVGGSPEISGTIFDKIAKADIFVADVSIINKDEKGRKVPNPNVLIELGYAFKALGHNNVILVMNTGFGGLELLPFDLRTRRVLTYNTTLEKTKELNDLVSKVKSQLEVIFDTTESNEDIQPSIIEIIKGQKPDRLAGLRVYMKSISDDLNKLYPGNGMLNATNDDPEYDQKIIDALEKTTGIIATFRNVVEEISLYDDFVSLKALFNGFKPILENFEAKKDTPDGRFHRARYDYYKFIGNEMFVIMISILLREGKWNFLKFVLEESIIINNIDGYKTGTVDFTYFSTDAICFAFRKARLKSNRADLRYDLLMDRRKKETEHTPGAIEEYTSADLFLFLKGESKVINSTDSSFDWCPWSLVSFETPLFVFLAKSKSFASGIVKALGIQSVQDLQILLSNKIPNVSKMYSGIFWRSPIEASTVQEVGTR
jgi:hypothetical protein